MKNVAVTGGAGFIGSHLVDALLAKGMKVVVIDDLSTGNEENINRDAEFWELNINDIHYSDLQNAEIDTIFHLAARARVQPSIENPLLFNQENVTGTLNLLECSRLAGVKRFIFSSSSSVYGDDASVPSSEDDQLAPLSPYAANKLIGEEYCKLYSRLHGLETACLRYFNVFGNRQPMSGAYCLVMGIFARQQLEGASMTITGTGEQRRDFTYVGDVVNANILAAEAEKTEELDFVGTTFNIGRGQNCTINEIAALFQGGTRYIEPRIEPFETLADNEKAKKLLGWEPTVDVTEWLPIWLEELGLL